MEFPEKVRSLLKAQRMSQSELAEELGTNQQQVSRWLEDESALPKAHWILAMARVLKVTTDYLIDPAIEEIPSVKETPRDEEAILRVYRSLKRTGAIDEDSAITGLMLAAKMPGIKETTGQPTDPETGLPIDPEESRASKRRRQA